MKFKKALAAFMAVSMTVALAAGCSTKEETDQVDGGEKTELQVAIFEGGYGREYWDAVQRKKQIKSMAVKRQNYRWQSSKADMEESTGMRSPRNSKKKMKE